MGTYSVSEKADSDLSDIYQHSTKEFGEQQADRYVRLLADSFQLLADNPELGQKSDHISAGLVHFSPNGTTHTVSGLPSFISAALPDAPPG